MKMLENIGVEAVVSLGKRLGAAEMLRDDARTFARGTKGLELRDGTRISKTGKDSRSVWEWKNSISKRNRGKGLRDTSFGKRFEGVMWKEGDRDRMSVCGELGQS